MDIVLSHTTAFRYWCAFEGDISLLERPRRASAMTETPDVGPDMAGELAAAGIVFGRDDPLHLLFAEASLRKRTRQTVAHVFAGKLPAGSLVRVSAHVLVASPELAFAQMAEVFAPEREAMAGCELCAAYGTRAGGETFSRGPLTTPWALQVFAQAFAGERSRAFAASCEVMAGAVSSLQAKTALLLALPTTRGGYSLPQPRLTDEGGLWWPAADFAVPGDALGDWIGDEDAFAAFAKVVGRGLGKYVRVRSAQFPKKQRALRQQLDIGQPQAA